MKGFSFVWCPPLGGSVTETAAEPQLKEEKWQEPFLSFSLYGPSGWGLSVYMWSVCVREWERERGRQTEKARQREREPLGSNKSGLHWTGGSCVGRQVSIAFRGRGYGQTHQSSHTQHTHTHTHTQGRRQGWNYPETKPISSSCTSLPCHSPLPHIWFCFKCEILLRSNNGSKQRHKQLL